MTGTPNMLQRLAEVDRQVGHAARLVSNDPLARQALACADTVLGNPHARRLIEAAHPAALEDVALWARRFGLLGAAEWSRGDFSGPAGEILAADGVR